MGEERKEEILLRIVEDLSYIKGKIEILDEIKAEAKVNDLRIDELVATTREHDKRISSSEHRHDEMEAYVRNSLSDSKKQSLKTFVSMGMSLFSIIVTAIVGFLFNQL